MKALIIICLIFKYFFYQNTVQKSILFLSIVIIIISSLTCFFRIINQWFTLKLSASIGHDLSHGVFKRTIYKPYQNHLSENTSNLIATISNEITYTVVVIEAIFNIFIALFIILFLITAMLFTKLEGSNNLRYTFFSISYLVILNK